MATEVNLPALGESVTEGTVTRWLKQVGDTVAVGEPLLEVSTDKVDTEIRSPDASTLLEIKVPEDETVEVGTELVLIGFDQPAAPQRPSPRSRPGRRTSSRSRRRARSRGRPGRSPPRDPHPPRRPQRSPRWHR
jgi:pyruvate dehydrogenase E2 component (dihydrolipoamide acetyltransferase)